MKFHELFNEWIKELGCTARELSEATGLSPAVISRYRSGTRAPLKGSQQLERLLTGLGELSARNGLSEHQRRLLEENLTAALTAHDGAFERFYPRFDALLSTMNITMKELSRAVNYDISFLYRIRAGKRRPHDLDEFISRICSFTVLNRTSPQALEKISELTGASPAAVATEKGRHQALMSFLAGHNIDVQSSMERFLRKMDVFSLNDYTVNLNLDPAQLPPSEPLLEPQKLYYGVSEMRQGQLDFFQQTLFSRSREPLFMCTDMPMLDIAEDEDFLGRWMLSMSAVLERGLRLNVIHELNRPWREMLVALESWIPLYMTGRISPYYLPKKAADLYHHLLFTSGSVALAGECIAGRHEHGRYELTMDPRELSYFKTRGKDLLRKARPLMEIYSSEREEEFFAFVRESRGLQADRRNILTRPPLYTLSQTLLWDILLHNELSASVREQILSHYLLERSSMRSLTAEHQLEDRFSVLTREEFERRPITLSLPHRFGPVFCTWEQYQAHVQETLNLKQKNYRSVALTPCFRNLDIYVVKGCYAVVCKYNPPVMHFVIRHPPLVAALENYVVLKQRDEPNL